MSINESIVLGVISGVFTSFVIFISVQLFRKIVIPWYQSIIYSGISIEGEWYSPVAKGSTQESTFTLNQSANHLSGTATFVDKKDANSEIRTFDVTGTIKDRFVHLLLSHSNKNRLGLSSFLLEIVGDGRTMQGERCLYSIVSNEIMSSPVVVIRKGSNIIQPSEIKVDGKASVPTQPK